MSSATPTYAELHENRAPALASSVGVFLLISIVCVSLRSYVRVVVSKGFGMDDAMIIFTLINYIIYAAFVFAGIHYGTGQHAAVLAPENYSHAMKMWYFCEIFYATASLLVRISIGLMLLRITTIPWQRILTYIVMTISTLMGVTLMFQLMFQCQPIQFFWSATRPAIEGHCIDPMITVDFVYAHGAISCICDWCLGLLPWLLVRKLNMNFRTKLTVGLLLCFANFGSLAMLIRFYTVREISTSTDFLFATVDLAIWSNLEIGVAIPAASLITLRPLFRNFFSSTKGTAENSHPSGPGFRGAGYIRHHTPSNLQMHNMERGLSNKGDVTTTITGRGSKGSLDGSSDEQPLQIRRDQQVDVQYSRAK